MEVHFIISKYSIEDKLSAISRVLDGGMSCYSSVQILGTVKSVVQTWVRKYEKYGIKGLSMKHGKYSGKFKNFVVEYIHKNYLSNLETSIKFRIPDSLTVGRWEQIYLEEGVYRLMKDNKRGRKKIEKIQNTKFPTEQSLRNCY